VGRGDDSMRIGNSTFEVRAVSFKSGWLVAGESLADVERVRDSLVNAELIFGAVLLVLMYAPHTWWAFAPFRRSPGTTSPT